MTQRTPVRKKRPGPPRRGRVRDEAYLAWIRTLPCVCCWIFSWINFREEYFSKQPDTIIEAAHIGTRGLGQKCSDHETAPLCPHHHRIARNSHHRLGKLFWDFWGIDRDKLISELRKRYEEQNESN